MRKTVVRIFILILSLSSLSLAQQKLTPLQALERIVRQQPAQSEWFAPIFLAQISPSKIDEINKYYADQLGAFVRIDTTADGFTIVCQRGDYPSHIHLDADGRVDGIWFGPPHLLQLSSLDDIFKELAVLPGAVSALVTDNHQPLAVLNPDRPLAVGSAFKLAVLAAANDQVVHGKLRLDQTFPLTARSKSLPSGILLNWPLNTPLTLATIENEMISISDNTAADLLISIVTPTSVEQFAPRNRPFLTTRQAFILKAPKNADLLDQYRKADEAARRSLLASVDAKPLPDVKIFAAGQPLATDVEWFFTANELADLITRTADSDALHINPGIADPAHWKQVAFKGGSEPGILNLTMALSSPSGHHYCVVITWNDQKPLDETRLVGLYTKILSTLESRQ